MSYFDESFNDFMAGLALNNEKSWFDTHRKIYENKVKQPWNEFLAELINEINKFDQIDNLPLNKFQFRINRDVRFSKDKTPYNPWVSAAIAKQGKKTAGPGYYIRLGVEGINLGGGYHSPEKEHVQKIRTYISKNGSELHKILNSKNFKSKWGNELSGDKNKIVPKELKAAAEKEPLIFNKGWLYWQHYPVDMITSDSLIEYCVDHFKAANSFNEYIKKALK